MRKGGITSMKKLALLTAASAQTYGVGKGKAPPPPPVVTKG